MRKNRDTEVLSKSLIFGGERPERRSPPKKSVVGKEALFIYYSNLTFIAFA